MADQIFFNDFQIPCRVGVTTEERQMPQNLRVFLELDLPLAKAGTSDSLGDTLDYDRLKRKIQSILVEKSFQLIEAVAETIARVCLLESKISAVRVRVTKNIYPDVAGVGVAIERRRRTNRRP